MTIFFLRQKFNLQTIGFFFSLLLLSKDFYNIFDRNIKVFFSQKNIAAMCIPSDLIVLLSCLLPYSKTMIL